MDGKRKIVLYKISFAVLIFLCAFALRCYKEPPPLPPGPFITPETRYPIGPGDIIEIKLVPDEIGVSGTYEVDDEGRILVPLVGEYYVVGMTSVGLKMQLQKIFSEYIKRPYVAVFVRQMKSQKIYVVKDESIGVIYVQRPLSVFEAVIIAGVSPKDNKLSRVYVIRWNEAKKSSDIYSVNIEKIVREGDFSQNIYLTPGDILYIPPKYVKNVREAIGFFSGIGYSLIFGFGGFRVLGIVK
jgi:protein involved in polysaccharide export with SLBB domain